METGYLNGQYLPKDQITISPEDRGFLFADGIYEVVRWYGNGFFDMEAHLARLKRSLRELEINWPQADSFPEISAELINKNGLQGKPALVYIEVTRGAAKRSHTFPSPPVSPTVYAFARSFVPESAGKENGIRVMITGDIRWSRCDIKSVALLPNTICFDKAMREGYEECIFVRNGLVTEGSHSNIFFVKDNTVFTHPESNFVLSGITRKNAIRVAAALGIELKEEAIPESALSSIDEAFITNTSAEITPVVYLGKTIVGTGKPGPVTMALRDKFRSETIHLSM